MKIKIIYFFLALLTLTSCGGGKAITGSSTANNSLALKDIIASHKKASPNFKTMAARVQLVYKDEKKEQSIVASLRIEKDKKIWIKASFLGVTIAKVLITPTSVSYYESVGKTYFQGDFSLLSEFLGTELSFEQAQAILLGQSIFQISNSGYKVDVVNNSYRLLPKKQPNDYITALFLEPTHFKVKSEMLSQPSESRLLTVNYGPYERLEGSVYPSEINIDATEGDDKTSIEINYRKIDLNVSVNFAFDIPDGYTEIRL
ncbi:DUF4292 domain-containing protein [Jejudonia soesokkakensis]|uniref:DUF4292 domain-containing protein n=1 Tax=Jejudonia soesokkakensis TaxID=1323432 RepID=A0ABW2MQG3_9FLAO